VFYWITLELFLWGFITVWLQGIVKEDLKTTLATVLIGGLIFWHIFYKAQQTVAISFLEEIWSRNVLNIFASPIKPKEFITGLIIICIADAVFSLLLMALLAGLLYAFNIWTLGFYIIPFFLNALIFGWALGLVIIGFLLRFGPGIEVMAWSLPILFQPFSAVFYPVSVLPVIFQKIAFFVPASHLFEGMRLIITKHVFPLDHIIWASILNVVYIIVGIMFFYWMLRSARKKGALSRMVTE
jgi:ABC-2 type transport system permease protein